ncbi:MAG: ACP S-malonyltransferase [Actinomycetota bacterium]
MIAVLAPGQGAQSPGMFTPWLELPGVEEKVVRYGELAGLDLIRLGTEADADEIRDTAVTQPLIVALGVVAAGELGLLASGTDDGSSAVVVAGHSVGELTAAAIAGVLRPEVAVAFAARRGAEMAAACGLTPTGMSAVLGGEPDAVLAGIAAAGLTPANRNGTGQVVAGGSLDALAALAADPPGGARVRPLAVAGAFHTNYMAPAEQALAGYVSTLGAPDPSHLLLSNADGTGLSDGPTILDRLVRQVTRPVRWDLCQHTLGDLEVSAAIELPPAGTLIGLAKRALPDIELLAVKTPADLASALVMIASRPQHGQGEHTPEFQVVVTPVKGIFTRAEAVDEGSAIVRGARLGTVRTNRDEHPIIAPDTGVLVEWLRNDNDIVAAGLPVARLHNHSEV